MSWVLLLPETDIAFVQNEETSHAGGLLMLVPAVGGG